MLTERLVAAVSLRCVEVEMEEKRSVFRGVDYSTKFLRKALKIKRFQMSDQKFDGK